MSTVDSTPKPQWEVTDELQKVSGPYTTTQLLQLATDGFLTSKSLVRHPQQTNGQWLEVMKIAKLASALEAKENRASNPFTTPPPAVTLNSSRSSPSSHRFESSSSLVDFFDWTMKRYLTPVLVQMVWILVLIGSLIVLALSIIAVVFAMFLPAAPGDPPKWFMGPFGILLYAFLTVMFLIFVRVVLEGVMVVFNNAKVLSEIRDRIDRSE